MNDQPAITPLPLTDPNDIHQILEAAIRLAKDVIRPQLTAELPPIHIARHYTDERGSHLEYLSPSSGLPPSISVTLEPDGFLIMRVFGFPDNSHSFSSATMNDSHLTLHIRNTIFNRTVVEMTPESIAPLIASGRLTQFRHAIESIAREIIEELTIPPPATDLPLQTPAPDDESPAEPSAQSQAVSSVPNLPLTLQCPDWKLFLERTFATYFCDTSRHETLYATSIQQINTSRGQTRPNPKPDSSAHQEQLNQIEDAARRAETQAPYWTPIRHVRDDQHNCIEVMFNGANPPIYTIAELSNGTITVNPEGISERNFNFNKTKPHSAAVHQVEELIVTELLKRHTNPATLFGYHYRNEFHTIAAHDIFDPTLPSIQIGSCSALVKRNASRILDQRLLPPELPDFPRTKSVQSTQISRLLTRAVRKSLAQSEITSYTQGQSRHTSGAATTLQYNIIAANSPILDQIPDSSVAAVNYFKSSIVPLYRRMTRFQHPGQIIKAVKRHLDIEDTLWRWFLRTGPHLGHQQEPDTNRVNARIHAALLRDANQPRPHPTRLSIVISCGYHSRYIRHAPLHTDDAWQAWTRAVGLYLGNPNEPTAEETAELNHIADAIRYQLDQHHIPHWPNEPWAEMVARADRIVERSTHGTRTNLRWETLLPVTTAGRFTFTPASCSAELRHWSSVMNNCLYSYDHRCAEESERIFIAHDDQSRLVAAVQVSANSGTWQPVQIEGPTRARVPDDLAPAAAQLAKLYQQAQNQPRKRNTEHAVSAKPLA